MLKECIENIQWVQQRRLHFNDMERRLRQELLEMSDRLLYITDEEEDVLQQLQDLEEYEELQHREANMLAAPTPDALLEPQSTRTLSP